jgi:hypothetical protein
MEKAFVISIISTALGVLLKYLFETLFKKDYTIITLFITSFSVYLFWNIFDIELKFEKKNINDSEFIHPAAYKK